MAETRQHRRVLKKCGYTRKSSKRAKEEKWVLEVDGSAKMLTSCPRGRGEIAPGTFTQMLKQLGLTREQYQPFYGCSQRQREYFEILREQGIDP